MITAERYHDISCGHRVFGHESKCSFLHGHNYRVHFVVAAETLDSIGRVIDFSVIKSKLCMWLEDNFDHKFLLWEKDPLLSLMQNIDYESIVPVKFNPTAENIAEYLVKEIGPQQLKGTGCQLIECRVEETRKCLATYKKIIL
jgi:6-pyruvoyltetrahydropterin/6-carboxytetrahydropterin synthase